VSAYYAMVVVVYDSDDDPDQAHEHVSERMGHSALFVGDPWEVNEVARDPNGDVFDTDDCLNQRRVA
jgi:hypothetical protein